MRFTLAMLVVFMLATPTFALAEKGNAEPGLFASLLDAILYSAGDELSGNDYVIETYNVDGNGRVVIIDEIILTINVGDVTLKAGSCTAALMDTRRR